MMSGDRFFEHPFQRLQPIGFGRQLVPAQAIDAGKSHGEPGLVAGGALQSFECNLEYKAPVRLVHHLAHRSKATDRLLAHETVDPKKLLVGESEIGLADRDQFAAVGTPAPNPKCVIRIE